MLLQRQHLCPVHRRRCAWMRRKEGLAQTACCHLSWPQTEGATRGSLDVSSRLHASALQGALRTEPVIFNMYGVVPESGGGQPNMHQTLSANLAADLA